MKFRKILYHPDKAKIIRMLNRGDGVRVVAKAIEEAYPKDKRLHLSVPTLQEFRKGYLNIEGDVLDDIKKSKSNIIEKNKFKKYIRNSPSYKEKLEEAVNVHIEIKKELQEMFVLLKSRMEDLFDRLEKGEGTKSDEQNFNKYFLIWISAIEKQAKYIDKIADHTIETTNVNITVIQDQMSVLREAVREVILEEMSPEVQIRFLEKLDNKMKNLNYKHDNTKINDIHNDVKILSSKLEE